MRRTSKNARKPLTEKEEAAELHLIADLNVVAGLKVVALKDNHPGTFK
jgi:hypothetical protein